MNFTTRFGSDAGTLRSEDEPLVTGYGRFTDDINVPGQAYAAFLRAPDERRDILIGSHHHGLHLRRLRRRGQAHQR